MDFYALAQECAPAVHPTTLAAIVHVESAFNPYAIGVVGGHLVRQPRNLPEALATANALEREGWNFSVGVAQVNRRHLKSRGIDYAQAFDACTNLRIGSEILTNCYSRANTVYRSEQIALQAAFSCYYSGNFTRGFAQEADGGSYVRRVLGSAARLSPRGGER
jgi:type IV secretion system protein VirB1